MTTAAAAATTVPGKCVTASRRHRTALWSLRSFASSFRFATTTAIRSKSAPRNRDTSAPVLLATAAASSPQAGGEFAAKPRKPGATPTTETGPRHRPSEFATTTIAAAAALRPT